MNIQFYLNDLVQRIIRFYFIFFLFFIFLFFNLPIK